jgi:hypothetical protein
MFHNCPDWLRSGFDRQNKPDLFLVLLGSTCGEEYSWADVQVIGEFRQGIASEYLQGLLHLCRYGREVFTSQPTRLFLHGFYIFGSIMELWIFDRSGLYSCETFDIHEKPDRLITTIAGYTMMSDDELGINTHIKNDELGKYILLKGDDETEAKKNYFEDQPIAFPQRIVSQRHTCYPAKRLASKGCEFVLKFSWRSDDRRSEEKILRLVKQRNVWGVVQLFSHQQLDSIANLRQGLRFGVPRKFLPTTSKASDTTQSKSEGSSPGGVNKFSVEARPAAPAHPSNESNPPFDNLTFCCLANYPLGRPLYKFETILEFLEGCRDAIKGHRSLYQDGKILHQDVSRDNIIILETKNEGGPRGILIDLDLAMELDVGPQMSGELIGTRAFVAIGLLERKPHTYRHDLESFIYVFLWIIICWGHKGLPPMSRLRRWTSGSWKHLAQRKIDDISKENFEKITSEFSPKFKDLKGLAEDLRQVLFPQRDGLLFTGTDDKPEDVDRLYDGLINAFDVAASSYAQRGANAGKI